VRRKRRTNAADSIRRLGPRERRAVNYHWNWRIFWEDAPDGVSTYFDTLLLGLYWTLATALCAWILALLIGSLVGTLRTTPRPKIVWLGNAYVELFRNIPLLVQMFLWFFVLPELLPASLGSWLKALHNASFFTAVVCLGFFTSARVAEQTRAGIEALPKGQRLAGTALGLSLPQTYRYVLLPQAFRILLPPLTSEFLNIFKNSAVALVINLPELTSATHTMAENSYAVFEAFSAATLIYAVINVIIVNLMRWVEYRIRVPGLIGTSAPGGH
jgi:glutamate/aspartate transport system permease protein